MEKAQERGTPTVPNGGTHGWSLPITALVALQREKATLRVHLMTTHWTKMQTEHLCPQAALAPLPRAGSERARYDLGVGPAGLPESASIGPHCPLPRPHCAPIPPGWLS